MSSVKISTLTIASVLAATALWSCDKNDAPGPEHVGAQEQPSSHMPAAGGDMMQQLRAGCPMVVEGAGVELTDTEGAVVLTFTTEAGDVDDLRTRVQHIAEMYEMHRGHRGMMWRHMGDQGRGHGGPGMGMGHMAGQGPMPAAATTVTEVDKGAQLELRPTDASQLEHLREHARLHQQRMESGECWMLQGQGNAPGDDQE